ncbi:hypothetical protein [Duganella sp. BJB476]|uniref:hypothetical protein n=1 Tax=Duganella sp. BJB476 TaxID=1871176 RepID=UPI0011C1885A|nr:hypothetical protein [Duganella sp. BJB476]
MQVMLSTQKIEMEVEKVVASLSLPTPVPLAELMDALRTGDAGPELELVISGFLSCASADLILQACCSASGADVGALHAIDSVVSLAERVRSGRASTLNIELRRVLVPPDFPAQPLAAALSGAHPKIALVAYGGKFYEPGTSPPEVLERWEVCEDLARQFAGKCLENEKGKYAHLSQKEILKQYLDRLLRTGWGSDVDMKWVIGRTAKQLSWDAPGEVSASLVQIPPDPN